MVFVADDEIDLQVFHPCLRIDDGWPFAAAGAIRDFADACVWVPTTLLALVVQMRIQRGAGVLIPCNLHVDPFGG